MIKKINLDELTFDNIGAWPLLAKIMMITLGGLLLCVGFYQYDLHSQLIELNVLQTEMSHSQGALTQQKQQLSERATYEKHLKILQQIWTAKTQQILNPNQIADLFTDITRIGIADGLQFRSVRPLSEQSKDNLTVLPVEIYVAGEYPQLARFLFQLTLFKQKISLQNFMLTGVNAATASDSQQPAKLTLMLLLNIYHASDDKNDAENLRSSPIQLSAQHNPFQSEANMDGMEALSTISVDTLQMVGYVREGPKQWALLATVNDHVYRVVSGTKVGSHHGEITKITSDKIEILEKEKGESKRLILWLRK